MSQIPSLLPFQPSVCTQVDARAIQALNARRDRTPVLRRELLLLRVLKNGSSPFPLFAAPFPESALPYYSLPSLTVCSRSTTRRIFFQKMAWAAADPPDDPCLPLSRLSVAQSRETLFESSISDSSKALLARVFSTPRG